MTIARKVITLPEETLRELQGVAKAEHRSTNAQIAHVIEAYLSGRREDEDADPSRAEVA